jgi:hypothetical protein
MKLEKAKQLKVGDSVRYPADQGNPAGAGTIRHIDTREQTHLLLAEPFLWVTLENADGVWPSNRLG